MKLEDLLDNLDSDVKVIVCFDVLKDVNCSPSVEIGRFNSAEYILRFCPEIIEMEITYIDVKEKGTIKVTLK